MPSFRAFVFASLASLLPAAALAGGPKAGGAAPDFTLPALLEGRPAVSLKSLDGRVVVIDFWASWCAPCAKTLPRLSGLLAAHPGLAVLAVTIDEDRGKAVDFLHRRKDDLTYLHDAQRKVAEAYDPGGMPSLMVIDRKGVLRYRHDGYTEGDMQTIAAEIDALLSEK